MCSKAIRECVLCECVVIFELDKSVCLAHDCHECVRGGT